MKRSGTSICIVLDEYGITSGLITMEDLIEEIVGEIRDEYDESENEIIRKLDDDTYDVEGSIRLDDLNDAIGTTISSDNYDTLGGYIIELLDRLPDEGDEASDGTVNLKVLSASHNRVDRVKIEIIRNEGEESEAQSEKESDE